MCVGCLSFQMGFTVGPVVHILAEFEPEILIQALLYTGCAFTSFTLVSLLSKRRSFLFLGGIIATTLQALFLWVLMSWFMGSSTYDSLPIMMISLCLSCMFIIYDTQLIVERAENGDKDVPAHTMVLFLDLFDLFIKILKILIKLKSEKKKK